MLKKFFGSLLLSVMFPCSVLACPNYLIPAPHFEAKIQANDALAATYSVFKSVAEIREREPRLWPHSYREIWSRLSEPSRWALVNQLKQNYPQYKREVLYYFLGNAMSPLFVLDFWKELVDWLSRPEFDVFAETNGMGAFELLEQQGQEAMIRLVHTDLQIKAQLRTESRANNGFWTLGLIESLQPENLSDERCEGDPSDSDLSAYDNPYNHEDRYNLSGQWQEQVSTGKIKRKAAVYNPVNHVLLTLQSKTMGDNPDMYALDPQTGKIHRLTWFEGDPRYGRLYDYSAYPRWSPDRQQIAFVMNDEVYTMRYDGTQLKRRIDRYPYHETVRGVDWLGSDLIFASEVRELPDLLQGNAHPTAPIFLFRLNLQAQTREQIPFSLNDGDDLLKRVYVHKNRILTEHTRRNPNRYSDWFDRGSQGDNPRKLGLPNAPLIEDLQLSPDGQFILYHKRLTKAEADRLKLGKNCTWHEGEFLCDSAPFVAKANGSNAKQILPYSEAYYSVWSQDGKKVYHLEYVHPDKGVDHILETRADGSAKRKIYQAPKGVRIGRLWP